MDARRVLVLEPFAYQMEHVRSRTDAQQRKKPFRPVPRFRKEREIPQVFSSEPHEKFALPAWLKPEPAPTVVNSTWASQPSEKAVFDPFQPVKLGADFSQDQSFSIGFGRASGGSRIWGNEVWG